jgi:cytoskeletal protein CcmA (bactofilin family)
MGFVKVTGNIQEDINASAETVIGHSVKIQGDLTGDGDIKIVGQVNGKITTSHGILVVEGGKIEAEVLAGSAIIGGEVRGNLKISGLLILQAAAKVIGDIACGVLRVEDGAQFTGKCCMKDVVPATGDRKSEVADLEPEN